MWQPLVLSGSQLPQLTGVREDRLEVLTVHNRKCVPIPFQLDKRGADGTYAMPAGLKPINLGQPGILEPNDELAMMLSDLGSANAAELCGRALVLQIEVRDPLGGPTRYAYIDATEVPRRSSLHYISYDSTADRIETGFYRIGLTAGLPTDFALQHRMHSGAPNLIDRFKVRTSARLLGLFSYRMNEDDIQNQLLAWKVGPVRMLRLENHSVNLLLGLKSPSAQSQVFIYRNYIESPTQVSFPWVPRLILDHVTVRLDVDYLNLSGFLLTWSDMNCPPVVIGSNSASERMLENASPGPPAQWMALRGSDRLLLQTSRPSPEFKLIQRMLYYRNSGAPDPPEKYSGQHPGVGYITTGYTRLSRGVHEFDSLFVIAPGSYRADTLFAEIGTPLSIEVREIGGH